MPYQIGTQQAGNNRGFVSTAARRRDVNSGYLSRKFDMLKQREEARYEAKLAKLGAQISDRAAKRDAELEKEAKKLEARLKGRAAKKGHKRAIKQIRVEGEEERETLGFEYGKKEDIAKTRDRLAAMRDWDQHLQIIDEKRVEANINKAQADRDADIEEAFIKLRAKLNEAANVEAAALNKVKRTTAQIRQKIAIIQLAEEQRNLKKAREANKKAKQLAPKLVQETKDFILAKIGKDAPGQEAYGEPVTREGGGDTIAWSLADDVADELEQIVQDKIDLADILSPGQKSELQDFLRDQTLAYEQRWTKKKGQ